MTANSSTLTLAWLLLAAPLCAQTTPSVPGGAAAAQALFEEGKWLMGRGEPELACPKFEESQRLDPGVGTLFNLGDCYERVGRSASAYSTFMDVAAATRQLGQSDREAVARARAERLKPRLNRLTIVVDRDNAPTGLVVERNQVSVGDAQWGAAIPIDPGAVLIRVSAPNRHAWQVEVEIEGEGTAQTVKVPQLRPLAPATEPSAPLNDSPPPVEPGYFDDTFHVAGAAAVGAGVLLAGFGTYFGLTAMSKQNDSAPYCDGSRCRPEGMGLRRDAMDFGNYATAAFIGAGVCLAAGTTFLFLDSNPAHAEPTIASVSVVATPGREQPFAGLQARVGGTF